MSNTWVYGCDGWYPAACWKGIDYLGYAKHLIALGYDAVNQLEKPSTPGRPRVIKEAA